MNATDTTPLRFAGRRSGWVQVESTLPDHAGVRVEIVSFTKAKAVHGTYDVVAIPSDFGDAFVVRSAKDEYQVCLSDEGSVCSCWDATKNEPCKHVYALQELRNAGII